MKTLPQIPLILDRVYNKPWTITGQAFSSIHSLIQSKLAFGNLAFMDYDDTDTPASSPYDVVGSVAVLNISGIILPKCSGLEAMCGAFSLETFRADLKAAVADARVSRVLFNIDSPGGSVQGVPETGDLIAELGKIKSIDAFSNGGIYSAAYWLACKCNTIAISQSAGAGSVGVYCYAVDSSGAFAKEGFKAILCKTGQFKGLGIDGVEIDAAQVAYLQAGVDKTFSQFIAAVTSARPQLTEDILREYSAATFEGDEAIDAGLADFLCDDLDAYLELLNTPDEK